MSTKKKPKKLRTPNVPMAVSGSGVLEGRGGGAEQAGTPRAEASRAQFDYTYVRQDLTRIGVLAGGFIALLVILSFFIR
jgi:hypothetical protein